MQLEVMKGKTVFTVLVFFAVGTGLCHSLDIISEITNAIDAAKNIKDGEVGIEKWSGVNLALGYSGLRLFPGVETTLWYTLGLDIFKLGYYARPGGGAYSPEELSAFDPSDIFYYSYRSQFSAGLSQGILWNDATDKNLLEWYIFHRFQEDDYYFAGDSMETHLLAVSGIPERGGFLLSYFISGIRLSTERRHYGSRIKEGITADLCGSWGPAYAANTVEGQTFHYGGVHFDFRGFLPYIEVLSKKGFNLFSIYQAFWFRTDYVFGPVIPLQVLQHFSGRRWEKGMGGNIRGMDAARYPAPLKVAGSTEFRFHFPAMGVRMLVPGAVLFCDAGYYNFLEDERFGSGDGFILSAGAGVFIDIFGMFELVYTLDYCFTEEKINGTRFSPIDFSLGLNI